VHRPGLDGIALYQRLARLRPELTQRLLFLTGDTVSEKTRAFLQRTGAAYLSKPVLIPNLLQRAQQIVERPSGQGELFA
jgi:two-component system NtrC family sensor kinase